MYFLSLQFGWHRVNCDDIHERFQSDNGICKDYTDEEIIAIIQSRQTNEDSSDGESEDKISHKTAIEAFDTCIKYLQIFHLVEHPLVPRCSSKRGSTVLFLVLFKFL